MINAKPLPPQADSPAAERLLRLSRVSKAYKTGSGDFVALKDITFDVARGEFLGIVGKSGAGKTTLLNMISGVSEVTDGEVLFFPPGSGGGRDVKPVPLHALTEDALAGWRGTNLGIVYQSFELLPTLDLVNNVMLPQDFAGLYRPTISREQAMELLDIVELTDHAFKLPAHISGGQKQRVAIARALVNDPLLIIADEPTGSLDTVTAETIFRIFERLIGRGKTIIMVTHDLGLAPRFSRVMTIADGVLERAVPLHPPTMSTPGPGAMNGVAVVEVASAEAGPPVPPIESEAARVEPQRNGEAERSRPPAADEPAIILRDVIKTYENAAGKFTALKGVNLQLHYGQFISIVGKSGSGKSTLLNMLTGIDHPTSGEVIIGGQDIYKLSESERARWRGRHMGIVFQFFQLLPTLTLLENVLLPMDYARVYPTGERLDRAMALLRLVGLEAHAHDLPASVSNGQQQTAAIARAIATDPPILVADEPTGNLDSRSAQQIIDMFRQLASQGKTILIVTHDPSLTRLTDQTVIISDGEIIDRTIAEALPMLDHPLMLQATQHARRRTYRPGEQILRQGEPVDHFAMVVEGEVEIFITRPPAPETPVARLGPGQFFGEIELLGDGRSLAGVRAAPECPVELALLPREEFDRLIHQSPEAHHALSQVADARRGENVSRTNRMVSHE